MVGPCEEVSPGSPRPVRHRCHPKTRVSCAGLRDRTVMRSAQAKALQHLPWQPDQGPNRSSSTPPVSIASHGRARARRMRARSLSSSLLAVLLVDPLTIVTAFDASDPFRVVQVPLNRFLDTGFKRLLGFPSKLAFDLAGVDGIAPVVPGTILDERDL